MDARLKDPLRRLPGISTLLAQRDGAVAEIAALESRVAEL
jgi:hypothetical protein